MDLAEKKLHVPLVDRTPIEPPPIVVCVAGPPKVSKITVFHHCCMFATVKCL
jgi:ribosome biogenesis protein BMS1